MSHVENSLEIPAHRIIQPELPESGGSSCTQPHLQGKQVAMVMFTLYPEDVRPRRAAEALVREGMRVEVICVGDKRSERREECNGVDVTRFAIPRERGRRHVYIVQYCGFLLLSALTMAVRALKRRYDLVYVHNMPDFLVFCAVVPKALGAKVILDMHDPMPELMETIFGAGARSAGGRLLRLLERWSMAFADRVITVNAACERIFSQRSCRREKIGVVMNSPDEDLFPLSKPRTSIAAQKCREPFAIIYHGSLVERNGLNTAIEALARVIKELPQAELRIYGCRTNYLECAMRKAREQGLEKAVRYLGPRRPEELFAEISKCQVGVIPNLKCTFSDINTPTRLFEYLAAGKPVVAPRTGGIQDYFNENCLFYFEAGSVQNLADTILYVASHPAEVAEATARAQCVYLQHTWSAERRRLIDIVSTIMAQRA